MKTPIYTDTIGLTAQWDASKKCYTFEAPKDYPQPAFSVAVQTGDPAADGHNGLTIEALIACARHRLQTYNQGKWHCAENDQAIKALNNSLRWLELRFFSTDLRRLVQEGSLLVDLESQPSAGDYVLAAKDECGEPHYDWAVGYYDGVRNGRHFLIDANGDEMRKSGFTYVGIIAPEIGQWLTKHADRLRASNPHAVSLWKLLREAKA